MMPGRGDGPAPVSRVAWNGCTNGGLSACTSAAICRSADSGTLRGGCMPARQACGERAPPAGTPTGRANGGVRLGIRRGGVPLEGESAGKLNLIGGVGARLGGGTPEAVRHRNARRRWTASCRREAAISRARVVLVRIAARRKAGSAGRSAPSVGPLEVDEGESAEQDRQGRGILGACRRWYS